MVRFLFKSNDDLVRYITHSSPSVKLKALTLLPEISKDTKF